jgi:hypothetical protein
MTVFARSVLAEFDFAPADLVFVEKLQNGEIAIYP